MSKEISAELDEFRRRWLEEVNIKANPPSTPPPEPDIIENGASSLPGRKLSPEPHDAARLQYNFNHATDSRNEAPGFQDGIKSILPRGDIPLSALDYYERAAECEAQGQYAESVSSYRKAYKIDEDIQAKYERKYLLPLQIKASEASSKISSTAPHLPLVVTKLSTPFPPTLPTSSLPALPTSDSSAPRAPLQLTTSELILSFSQTSVSGAPPLIERTPPPPCPMATLPAEVLIQILLQLALQDPGAFVRVSRVCKRLAYLVTTEDQIWRKVVFSYSHGFGAMHTNFACSIDGIPIEFPVLLPNGRYQPQGLEDSADAEHVAFHANLKLSLSFPTWLSIYRYRPRIRFSGIYISTVTYMRHGLSNATPISWNSPMHKVTYFRYLRFFRDGSCISLLTTSEPHDVIAALSRDFCTGQFSSTILNIVGHVLRGRWKISPPSSGNVQAINVGKAGSSDLVAPFHSHLDGLEGHVTIETQSPSPTHAQRMEVTLRSRTGSAWKRVAQNTKLSWRGYWGYNYRTDEWNQYGLTNDRSFVWSRVRSWE